MNDVTITEFLLARIAEDEDAARAATGSDPLMVLNARCDVIKAEIIDEPYVHAAGGLMDRVQRDIASLLPRSLHDPRRMLAECEAKRRIVKLHDEALRTEVANGDASAMGADLMHMDVMRLLALPYADHSDYDEALAHLT